MKRLELVLRYDAKSRTRVRDALRIIVRSKAPPDEIRSRRKVSAFGAAPVVLRTFGEIPPKESARLAGKDQRRVYDVTMRAWRNEEAPAGLSVISEIAGCVVRPVFIGTGPKVLNSDFDRLGRETGGLWEPVAGGRVGV